ncbi:MAG TPA: hypothetical protein VGE01_11065 [Fimbriimonas sp.]
MKPTLALLVAAALCGCAKFPEDGGGTANVTRIQFRMRVQGKINTTLDNDPITNYIYAVAIRASADENPNPETNPQPVFSAPHPNGFVQGEPTHFVLFDSINPQSQYPYVLYRFARTGDPENPINLASWTRVDQQIINFVRPDAGSNELRFDLFINQLADSVEEQNSLRFLQVNFLTMNRYARDTVSGRQQDYLGNNNNPVDVNKAITIDLRTNTVRENDNDYEPTGDTPDPDLDIVDWSVQVVRP